jgi:DNA-binding response OmpR family regulator
MVDDDPDHLLICQKILERAGFEVLGIPGCERIDSLVERVQEFRPGLLFIDHEMPVLNGGEITRALKTRPETRTIPVFCFSGRSDIRELASKAGADGFIQKPFEISGLVNIARQHLRRPAA